MKILFTGSSSFTGYWFIRELAASGHDIVATFRGSEPSYQGIRGQRVSALTREAQCVFGCPFGSDRMMELIASEDRWDVLCHHGADVTDYKSPHFNALVALENNVKRLPDVLEALKAKKCHRVVLTGSVFEQGEGLGTEPERAFSPYGLSKGMTSDYFRYYCQSYGIAMGKFVISNPFGPYEEPRLTSYLVHTWAKGEVAEIKTPEYVRDNIHISLLAEVYAYFVSNLSDATPFLRRAPSGYVESQGSFVRRFAEAMRPRLGLPCEVRLLEQDSFPEPRVRINSEPVLEQVVGWDEERAWDAISSYYRTLLGLKIDHRH